MARQYWRPSNMLYPVPPVMLSCADEEGRANIMTAAWAGTICSDPVMVSVSIRPERYSHDVIERTGEFVINLTTEKLTRAIAAKTRAEWVALTGGGEDCVTPVYSLDEALDTELTKESGMLETRTEDLHGTACDITYLKPAMRLSATPGRIRRRAPYVGEDNQEVLRALGYRDEEIDALREKGAI